MYSRGIGSIVLLLILVSQALGQANMHPAFLEVNPTAMGFIRETKYRPTGIKGTVYYEEQWQIGNILLDNQQKIENVPLRYDLRKNEIEALLKDTVRLMRNEKIREFEWLNMNTMQKERFINPDYHPKKLGLAGFVRVWAEGKISLLEKPLLSVKSSDYIPALNAGSRENVFVKQSKFFLFNSQEKLIPFKKNKKQLLGMMADQAREMEEFARQQRLSFNKTGDLAKILNKYNQINQEK